MTQEIYGDRVSVGCSEKWTNKSILKIRCSKFSADSFRFGLSFGWSLCNIYILYACNHNFLCRTLRTAVGGNSNSLAAIRMDFRKKRLNNCLTRAIFSADVLGRPLLTASNTLTLPHKFLVPSTNWRTWWWIFPILSPVPSLSLNIRVCFSEPGYTLCLLLRSNHLIRLCLTHS